MVFMDFPDIAQRRVVLGKYFPSVVSCLTSSILGLDACYVST